MKKHFAAAALLILSVTVFPALPAVMGKGPAKGVGGVPVLPVKSPLTSGKTADIPSFSDKPYKVLDTESGQVMEVSVRDYVIGAVCAEMPASFGEEALKAQAVAAHTYAERQRLRESESPTPELMGADFSDDTSKYQGFFTKEEIKERFGDRFERDYGKISAAADEVLPYILTYDGAPIIAAFHSMSAGFTESAENAWGSPVDYLVEVDSRSDLTAPKFREDKRFTAEELKTALETAFEGVSLGDNKEDWLKVLTVSGSGTVLEVSVGDRTVTGNQLRTALDLRSAAFDVRCEGDEIIITTKGFGHGVGMSQYGADAMASEGHSWQEILAHYYPNCTVSGS